MINGETTPYANCVFEQPWWLDCVAPGEWDEIVLREKDRVVARLPFVCRKKRIIMPDQTQTLGPWIETQISEPDYKRLETTKKRIALLLEGLSGYRFIDIAIHKSNSFFLPFRWEGYIISPAVSYTIEDLTDLDAVFSRFSKNIKRDIKAAAMKLTIKDAFDVDLLYGMLETTYKRQHRNPTSDYATLKRLVAKVESRKAGKMLTAYDKEGHACASAFFVFDINACYYLKGGTDYRFASLNANTLLIWEGIKFASTVSREFDFEGSCVEGISDYFNRFGGKPQVYYRISKKPLLFEAVSLLRPRIKRLLGYRN